MEPTIIPFRERIKTQLVSWLVNTNNYRIMYSCARLLDILMEQSLYGVKHRWPNYVDGESLPYLGRDRRLTRGVFETDEGYAIRLRDFINLNKRKGSVEELIRQIANFFGEVQWNCVMTIYGDGERLSMQSGDSTIYRDTTPFTASPSQKSFVTVVIVRDDLLTPHEAESLKVICSEFKAAHILGQCGQLGGGREFYSEVPQLPSPMTPITATGIGGFYSETGEFYSSADPIMFTF